MNEIHDCGAECGSTADEFSPEYPALPFTQVAFQVMEHRRLSPPEGAAPKFREHTFAIDNVSHTGARLLKWGMYGWVRRPLVD